jgi:hypothetical protein
MELFRSNGTPCLTYLHTMPRNEDMEKNPEKYFPGVGMDIIRDEFDPVSMYRTTHEKFLQNQRRGEISAMNWRINVAFCPTGFLTLDRHYLGSVERNEERVLHARFYVFFAPSLLDRILFPPPQTWLSLY